MNVRPMSIKIFTNRLRSSFSLSECKCPETVRNCGDNKSGRKGAMSIVKITLLRPLLR